MQIKHYTSPYSNKMYDRYLSGTGQKHLLDIKDNFTPSEPPEKPYLYSFELMNDFGRERNFIKDTRKRYNVNLALQSVSRGTLGAAIGYLLVGKALGPVGGAAAGAAVGLFMAWDKASSEDKGKVEINIDGQKFTEKYYMDPYDYKKGPELEKKLTGDYDAIYAVEIDAGKLLKGKEPDREKLQSLKPYANKLLELGKNRRLLVDMKDKSKHEKEALHVIDSNLAKDLIAAGQTVYVINGSNVTETPHSYKAVASNSAHTVLVQEAHDFMEKQIDYTLTQIKSPEDLAKIKDGKGVPEGLQGVYKKENTYKETVYADSRQGSGKIYENGNRTSYDSITNSRLKDYDMAGDSEEVKITHHMDISRIAGLFSGLGTYMVATALGAGPQGGGLALIGGAVGGYLAGKRLMRSRKFLNKFQMPDGVSL